MGQIYHNKFLAMNTRFHAIFPEMDDENADRIFSMVKQEVNRVENKLSRFIPDSDVSRVNKRAAVEPVKVDAELFEVFSACRFCWELTGGAFDLTLRPLMEHWEKNPGGTESGQDLLQLKDSVGMNLVELDAEHQTVRFHHENVEADLGGFGKGYALEKVKNILGEASVQHAFVSFGESSILALGNHPAGDWWKVGMNDYLNPGKSLYEFKVSGGSVSTSSNFYVDNGGILKNHNM
jgi:FAD:protein FMN transferase